MPDATRQHSHNRPTSDAPPTPAASVALRQPSTIAWLGRMRHVAGVVLRHGISAAADRFGWTAVSARLTRAGLTGPMRFRVALEDLGGSFVKFGQVLAVQPDLLPPGYATQLLDLLDRVAPIS